MLPGKQSIDSITPPCGLTQVVPSAGTFVPSPRASSAPALREWVTVPCHRLLGDRVPSPPKDFSLLKLPICSRDHQVVSLLL